MQTILKHCSAVLCRLIFIGFGIQIVLGILWMYNAFIGFKKPGEGIVCVGAISLVGASVWFVAHRIYPKASLWKKILVTLTVLTFPFVMQSLVNPDIRVVLTAFLLVLSGVVFPMLAKKKGIGCVITSLCFLLLFGSLTLGCDRLRQGWTPLNYRWSERVAWTTLYDSSLHLSDEKSALVDYFVLINATYETGGMRDILIPHLVEEHGKEQTLEILEELRSIAWGMNKSRIIKECIWDLAGYTMAPVVVPIQLSGRAYDSYTGINYGELLQPAPRLGKEYANYSCWWFGVAFICAVLLGICRVIKSGKITGVVPWLVLGLAGLGMVCWFSMDGAGKMDYKNTLFVLCTWLIWMMGGTQDEKN